MDDKQISKKDGFIFVIGVLIALVVVVISASLFYIKNYRLTDKTSIVDTTPSQNKEGQDVTNSNDSTDNKVESINKDSKIVVLNGSGKKGLAGSYKDVLNNLGFKNVTAANTTLSSESILVAPFDDPEFMKSVGITEYKYKQGDEINLIVIK